MDNRSGIIDRLRSKVTTVDEFNYDKLTAPPLSCLLTQYDIDRLYNIATSARYSGNIEKKTKAMNEILNPRGFIKFAEGTNRRCYRFVDNDDFVIKVAFGSVAIHDSPSEFNNQFTLKPFCTKVFEVDPCGVVGSFERVDPIKSREEFMSVWEDAYELIFGWLMSNGHIMADIGTKYFMNYGIRRGFGLVVTDFPYLYEIDGNKLYCNAPSRDSPTGVCGGLIDCDAGCNELHCELCGTRYRFKEIAKKIQNESIIIKGGTKMNKKPKAKVKITVKGTPINLSNGADELLSMAERSTSGVRETVRPTAPSGKGNVRIGTRTEGGNVQQKTQTKPNNQQQDKPRQAPPQREYSRGTTSTAAPKVTQEVIQGQAIMPGSNVVSGSTPTARVNTMSVNIGPGSNNAMTQPVAPSADDNAIQEMERLRITVEQQQQQLEEINKELEQCKTDLNAAEEQKESINKEWFDLKGQYDELIRQANAASDLAASRKENIDKLEETKAGLISDIDTLKGSNKNLKALMEEKDKIIGELKAEIGRYETEKTNATDQAAEANTETQRKIKELTDIIKNMNMDIADFCDLTLRANEAILKPEMAAEAGFEAAAIQDIDVATLDGTICALSDIFDGIEDNVDRYIMAFRNADGSYLSTADGRIIMITSIGGLPLDELVHENILEFADENIITKYFEELTEEELSDEADEEVDDEPAEVDTAEDEADVADESGED